VKSLEKFAPPERLPFSNALRKQCLSICMIVKNEASILGRCLESIRDIADEIIVVDTGSTDATKAIAQKFGARVVFSEWKNDFSFSRNLSLQAAGCEWICWLDADDVVPGSSVAGINSLKKGSPDNVLGFVVRNEKPGDTGTEFIQARMFPNRPDIFFERRIHEQMMLSALRQGLRLVETDIVIEHYGYADPISVNLKARRNIPLLLMEYLDFGPDPIMAIEIADSYSIIAETAEAQSWYEKTLQIPDCESGFPEIASQACLGLGNLRNTAAEYAAAVDYFQKALLLSPGRVDVLFSLAVGLELSGRAADAIDCLKKIIRSVPAPTKIGIDFREAKIKSYLRLGRLLVDNNRSKEALDLAEEAVAILPLRPEIRNMAGRVFFRNKKWMEALHAFEKSLEIEKAHNVDAYVGLCMIFQCAGKTDTALQTILSIQPIFNDSPRFWALSRLICGTAFPQKPPGAVNPMDIDKEEKMIRDVYGQ
jgi:glycosyltransferase involved in cell wall biosynthesis